MKNLFLIAARSLVGGSVLFTLALNFACTPGGSGSGGGPAQGAQAPVAQGTVSGGGGNGCDGKAFEAYAKKISTLEEYRLYLRPILRRMSEEGSDPLVTYLLWAADSKAWYFIPCELEKLSTEQIGFAVDADQLARQSEHGIYIHARESDPARAANLAPLKTYFQKKSKEKAVLLLHEMVMGALLLMKKPAKEQCAALASKNSKFCSDAEGLAIAEAQDIDPKDAKIMDAADHEAIRAMTSFLAEKGADLSAESVKVARDRFGFRFPWSRAASNLNYDDVMNAFARSRLLDDQFVAIDGAGSEAGQEPTTCSIAMEDWNRDKAYSGNQFDVKLATKFKPTGPKSLPAEFAAAEKFRKSHGFESWNVVCADSADRLYERSGVDKHGNHFYRSCENEKSVYARSDSQFLFNFDRNSVRTRGVIRAGVVYDELTLSYVYADESSARLKIANRDLRAGIVHILITRDESPRIQSIRLDGKHVLEKPKASEVKDKSAVPDVELLEIPGSPAIECVRRSRT